MQTITATELARHTREVLDTIGRTGESVAIKRNHALVAKIVPARPGVTVGQALAGLPAPMLSADQAASWLQDSRQGPRDELRDPWA